AVAETVTWTMLIAGMILKYVVQLGDWPVRVGGLSHGIVFTAYTLTALLVGINQHWRPRQIAAAVATAVVPYATIPFDRWLNRRGMLDGPWRREASADPRDHTRLSALLRGFLRHPYLLSLAMIAGVAIIVSVLLWLGPPTQWFA
ncbi:MAG TPA: DUF3817 domain-containing protein, partial [Actinomycetaceae bacterium]|nr:DUF3817 domain-containing protein [Actinomycetaceae bacterium]